MGGVFLIIVIPTAPVAPPSQNGEEGQEGARGGGAEEEGQEEGRRQEVNLRSLANVWRAPARLPTGGVSACAPARTNPLSRVSGRSAAWRERAMR